MTQLLNPPKPPRRTLKVEPIGTTGYAVRIFEDKGGQLIHLGSFGETLMAEIPESELDHFSYSLHEALGNTR